MFGYAACVWSSLALLPMCAVLASKGSWLWVLYSAAAMVAFLYHWHRERRFVVADHALAWVCIAANIWLALNAIDWRFPASALGFIGMAIERYYAAHEGDELDYCHHHTVWHLWCGMGGLMLAIGYH